MIANHSQAAWDTSAFDAVYLVLRARHELDQAVVGVKTEDPRDHFWAGCAFRAKVDPRASMTSPTFKWISYIYLLHRCNQCLDTVRGYCSGQ